MAPRKTARPAFSAIDVTHTLASAKPVTCGKAFAVLVTKTTAVTASKFAAEDCKRLPRHHGDHVAAKPRGLMTAAERKAATAKRVTKTGSKVVTVGGTKFRVFADGKVQPIAAEATVAAKVARKPRVRTIPAADSRRQVAAPRKATRRSRTAQPSGRPSSRLA